MYHHLPSFRERLLGAVMTVHAEMDMCVFQMLVMALLLS